MTVNKKISLSLGSAIIVFAAGMAVWQNAQSQNYPASSADSTNTVAAATSSNQTSVSDSDSQASSSYTLADVAQHSTASSCWTAINGGVYDVTTWINQHPGGPEHILSLCGTDGSAAFNAQHGGQSRPEAELATFKIGTLSQ